MSFSFDLVLVFHSVLVLVLVLTLVLVLSLLVLVLNTITRITRTVPYLVTRSAGSGQCAGVCNCSKSLPTTKANQNVPVRA